MPAAGAERKMARGDAYTACKLAFQGYADRGAPARKALICKALRGPERASFQARPPSRKMGKMRITSRAVLECLLRQAPERRAGQASGVAGGSYSCETYII